MANPKRVYQIKITLDRIRPPIWRRVLVPEDITLHDLHYIIQIVMDWHGGHLHAFNIGYDTYSEPEADIGAKSELKVKLNRVVTQEKAKFKYEYDFGDSWEHTILVEKILPAEEGVHYPVCIKGKRATPPEDSGGVWGYEAMLESIADPDDEERENYLEWLGGDFDPEEFDLEFINEILQKMRMKID